MSYLMKGLEQKMLTKKRFMKRIIPKFFCQEESIPENHAEVEQAPIEHEASEGQQAPEEVQAKPTSIAQSRPRRVIKPP